MSIYKKFPLAGTSGSTFVLCATPTGSRRICNPPPEGSDMDWIVLAESESLYGWLTQRGWEVEGGYAVSGTACEGDFRSFRKEEINLIVTSKRDFYNAFSLATKVARRLNLLEKKDRVVLFQAILYGNEPEIELGDFFL